MDESPGADLAPAGGSAADRLDSWKKIASYLKRDVSTVQRWERREAMPVHRHLHDKRGSVYALTAELEAWRASRGALFERATTEEMPLNQSGSAAAEGGSPGRRWPS